jgi:hypothetical protein
MNQTYAASRFVWFAGAGSLAVLGALIAYAIRNGTGHTGFEPWFLSVVFAVSLIIGFAALFSSRSRTAAIVTCTAGIAGLALLLFLDHFNLLLQYDRWLQRGMP